MTVHRIKLPFGSRPPLHANQRMGHHEKARVTAQVRRDCGWTVRAQRLGRHEHVTVGLEWRPTTNRRRDGGENLAPLLKAAVDSIVDAGVVPDDVPEHVTRTMPALLPVGEGEPGMWLTVETP